MRTVITQISSIEYIVQQMRAVTAKACFIEDVIQLINTLIGTSYAIRGYG